ncbi:uncharacterized protein LOC130767462 [Actinidia eriantha]|uniref:uncharacterized protein LOC130767462 n=1 Tax=Actinidia eriantha TaxID=165200 RepID=UPI00258B39A4|nr:uncharacterized protein LOC130767462 [Actinidia eriantha]
MDVSVQYVDPVKDDLISPDNWGQLWSNCKQGSSTMGGLVAELGAALVLLSTSAPALEGCDVCRLEKDKECVELVVDQDESLIVTPQEKLEEHVMMPRSRNMLLCDAPASGKEQILNTVSYGQSSLEPGNPTGTSIKPLPVSLKLISAMKGSREKQGFLVEKLSVKWAPDVFDPPATSQSHTVKSYSQYSSKTSKKSHRHKHKGAKGVDKKQRRKTVKSSSKVASY